MELTYLKKSVYWNNRFKSGLIYGRNPSKYVDLIAEFLGNKQDVLVIGGGYGRHASGFAKRGFNVLCVDISSEAVALGKKLYSFDNLKFKISDVFNLVLNNKFDSVVALYLLSLFKRSAVVVLIKKILSFLKPGGLIVMNFLNFEDCEYGLGTKLDKNTFIQDDGLLVRFYTLNEIKSLLSDLGVVVLKVIKMKESRLIHGKECISSSFLIIAKKIKVD